MQVRQARVKDQRIPFHFVTSHELPEAGSGRALDAAFGISIKNSQAGQYRKARFLRNAIQCMYRSIDTTARDFCIGDVRGDEDEPLV